MNLSIFVFLGSGLFLGWSLGANHLANVFGTALATRMVSFRTAARICSVCVVLGAVISGAGPSETLGQLGSVSTLGGAFMVALAAGSSVFWMTRLGLPVSTTTAIVGGIVGWNLFSATTTDMPTLVKMMVSWVAGPVLAAAVAMVLYRVVQRLLYGSNLHLLRIDAYTRLGLVCAGALGAYSLGANNIANVVGVFLPVSPFLELRVGNVVILSAAQQLFLIGGIAIAVGVYTYSHKVVHTVGADLLRMSPAAAFVVVTAHSLVLMVFTSQGLQHWLTAAGLPAVPLVPVSSTEVAVGAVIGIGLLQGGAGIRWRVLGRIAVGWVLTPVIAALVSFFGLFFVQNVFHQEVYRSAQHGNPAVEQTVAAEGMSLPTESYNK